MIWWANAQPLPAVQQPAILRDLWAGTPARTGQRAWLIHLDNEFGVPVMAGVVENVSDQLLTIGFAARQSPVDAALKAWAEALTLQEGCRDLLNPTGGYRRSVQRADINGRFVKPYRPDRRYLDDYRSDFRDVVDLMCQLQLHLDPRAVARVRSWIDLPARRAWEDLPYLTDGTLETYRKIVEARGFEIYYADVTTPDIAATGMFVVRVIIPGTVPNFAAAFPFQGRRGRLRESAVSLGWRASPLPEEEINIFPMPHA
jgi:ribosomal protein S12 methylthiotransferase accessory factor